MFVDYRRALFAFRLSLRTATRSSPSEGCHAQSAVAPRPEALPVLETTAPDAGHAQGDDDVVVAPEASPVGRRRRGRGGERSPSATRPRRPRPATRPAVSPQKAAYDKELAAVTKLRTDLGKHKQAAHVKDKTDQPTPRSRRRDAGRRRPTGRRR
jgi:hypothetical protein